MAAAAGVELTHLASLYHDDVMDEATCARGTPSANARCGNSRDPGRRPAVRQASQLVAGLGAEAVRLQARTFERLCTGQIRETPAPDGDDPVEHYLGSWRTRPAR